MLQNSPLVLDFQTDGGNEYVYDGVTNRVFFTPPPMREIIRSYRQKEREPMIAELSRTYPIELLEDYYDQVRRWVDIDKAFFLEEPVPEPPVSQELDRKSRRESRMPHLILVVTQDCNMACKYCVQETSEQSMSFDVARAGIDRFFEHNADPAQKALDRVSIGFYGGEPLLELDLVRRCVEYVKSEVNWPFNCEFFMTTNGTLLRDEVLEYLVANDFYLSISLDGPKDAHDRNRATRGGAGTFDPIFRTLMHIREKHPAYYRSRMNLIATFDFGSDVRAIVNWFSENRRILPPLGRASLASSSEKTCHRFTCDTIRNWRSRHNDIFAALKETLAHDPTYETLRSCWYPLFGPQLFTMADKRHRPAWQVSRIGCWPGVSRLTLYPDGTFHVCERIVPTHAIGDIQRGLDIQKIDCLVSAYLTDIVRKNDCRSCIAQQTCVPCYVDLPGGYGRGLSCDRERRFLAAELQYWYSIFESNIEVMKCVKGSREAGQTILDAAL